MPASTASIAASAATTVLPLPTSPCTRRSIGDGCARSLRICANTRCCAPVSENGKADCSCVDQLALARKYWRAMPLQGDALAAQAEVVGQQFLQGQAPLRRMGAGRERGKIRIARGPVHAEQRLAQRRQLHAAQHLRRQQFQRGRIGQAIQCLSDQLAHRGRADALDLGIDRIQFLAQRIRIGFAQHPVTGMHDLQPVLAGLGRAVAAHARAGHELRHLRGAEMEETQHQRACESSPIATRSIGR